MILICPGKEKVARKNVKALVAGAASVASASSAFSEKCKVCDTAVEDEDFGVACEICESWFHIKCEGMSSDEYKFLDAHKSLHWYCKACNKSVANAIKLFSSLKLKVENMELKLNKICDGVLPEKLTESIESKIAEAVDIVENKISKLVTEFHDLKDQVSSSATKLETAIEAKLVDSVDTIKKDLAPFMGFNCQ